MNTQKRNKIIYWVATLWLALGMLSTGIVQLIKEPATVDVMTQMGFPLYFLTILGVGKVSGVVALLAPKFPLVKEWAYAGFSFVVVGAAFTYISVGNYGDLYHLGVLAVLIVVSWYFRPSDRTLFRQNKN